jgi:hypothetical protein
MNIYKEAIQRNVTFETLRGVVLLSHLFALPLKATMAKATVTKAISLDGLYSGLMQEKATFNTTSYLGSVDNKAITLIDLKLALLKDVMDTKIAELNVASTRADLEQERKSLLAEKANRLAAAPAKLSKDELEAKLAALDKELT